MTYYETVVKVFTNEIKKINPNETAPFEKPQTLGCFSLDKDRNYIPNATNMMYYYPRFNEMNDGQTLDLNQGLEIVQRKPENLDEKLNNLLNFILTHRSKLCTVNDEFNSNRLNVDFVCYRGLLTRLMYSIYDKQEAWTISATKYKGTIYLHLQENKETSFHLPKDVQERLCSWGFKFEQYMLTDQVGRPPDTSKPVYESEEFCCVFRSKLGPHRMMYGAEMDGVISDKKIDKETMDLNRLDFIELKTSKQVYSSNDEKTLHSHKFIKWWIQSFLVNIQQVHCGFRNKKGLVQEITPFFVKELPKLSQNYWNWRTCLNFCNIILNIIKETIPFETNDKYTVWNFHWSPEFEHISFKKYGRGSPYVFLPEWYSI